MAEFSARSVCVAACALAITASCGGRSNTLHVEMILPSETAGAGGSGAGSGSGNSAGFRASDGGSGGNEGILPQFGCGTVASQQFDAAHMEAYSVSPDVNRAVDATRSSMSASDKALQMSGIPVGAMDFTDLNRSPDVTVAGLGVIRGYRYRNASRGADLVQGQPTNRLSDGKDFSTAFPAASVRAASWDLDLEKRVGEAIGDEIAASRNNIALAPDMNIIRHPYWGRVQDTYGEDMYHLGRMASAFSVGLQTHVLACANHFAANNIELRKSTQDAVMNEQTLREIYGRHFEMVVQDAGVGCVMASYNEINGTKTTQNSHVLRDILKGRLDQGGFGFQGFVISDLFAMPGDSSVPSQDQALSDTKDALRAGLDVEAPWSLHYSPLTLAQGDPALVEDAVRRILTQKFRFKTALDTDGWSRSPSGVKSELSGASIATNVEHESLAEEAELKSAVLLQNGAAGAPVLPLAGASKNIAVLGPDRQFDLYTSSVPKSCEPLVDQNPRHCNFHFATDVSLGDRGSNMINCDPARAIGPYQGIKDAAGADRKVSSGNSADAVADADTIVVVVGYTAGDEGEEFTIAQGGDRSTLDLPEGQNEFVNRVLDRNKPTIIVVNSGSIVNVPWLSHANKNQATIWAGYGGVRGGAALGKLIFGAANFSGKMPMAWPTQAQLDQTPFKDSDTRTAMGYFFGYREYDRRKAEGKEVNLVFPFGQGLSYSRFEYSGLNVPCQTASAGAILNVSVDIENTSAVDGDEIAMLFIKPPAKPIGITGDRPVKELKSFGRVSIKAKQRATLQLPLRIRDLRRWEGDANGHWVIDSGAYTILVGKNADDADTSTTRGTLNVQAD